MDKKRIALFSCAALVASGIGLNIQNALSDYGIGENSLSLVAVGPGSNSGSNSNSNSNSNWDSNTNTGPWDESDSNGLDDETKFHKRQYTKCDYDVPGPKNKSLHYDIPGVESGDDKFDDKGHFKKQIDYNSTYCDEGGLENCTPNPCPNITVTY